jgi:hypothetical protein
MHKLAHARRNSHGANHDQENQHSQNNGEDNVANRRASFKAMHDDIDTGKVIIIIMQQRRGTYCPGNFSSSTYSPFSHLCAHLVAIIFNNIN